MDKLTSKACGLEWFADKETAKVFESLEYAAVYAIGPGPAMKKFGWGIMLPEKFRTIQSANYEPLQVKCVLWTEGSLFAERLLREATSILDEKKLRVRGDWFNVPTPFVESLFYVAADRTKIKVFEHDTMIERVVAERERRIRRLVGD